MKHVFILNPAAGKHDSTGELATKIRAFCAQNKLNHEIFVSKVAGDCARIAREQADKGGELRVYACGGDGTLNEVVNGVFGRANVAITHFPCGSGNDFIKIFSDPSAFSDLSRLLNCEETRLDLIRCQEDTYSINICSMGFDARIGTQVGNYKKLPLVTGSGAYMLSVIANLIKGVHRHYVVELDGERFDGRQTMICISNGRYYGGGFYATPDAEPDDGLLDVLLVKAVSRATILRVISRYKNGQYRQLPELITHFRCSQVKIQCDEESEINIDGELQMAEKAVFSIVPYAIRFFYPSGLSYHSNQNT